MHPRHHHHIVGSARHGSSGNRGLVGLGAAGILVLVAACGGSDDAVETDASSPSDDAQTTVESSLSPPATDAPEVTEPDTSDAIATEESTAIPADAWAESILTAWNDFLIGRAEAAVLAIEGQLRGDHIVDRTQAWVTAEAAAIDDFENELAAEPDDADLNQAAEPLRGLAVEMATAATTLRQLGENDPDAIRTEVDAAFPEFPPIEWADAYVAYDYSARLDDACFTLQDALTAAGHGVLDCAGSSITFPLVGDLLDAGMHELTRFGPGLTLELQEPSVVFEAADFVDTSDPEDEVKVSFVDLAEVVDPAGLANGQDPYETIPIPDDLGPWLAQLPVVVLEQGTLDTTTGPAPFWDLQVDTNQASALGGEVFLELARYGFADQGMAYGLIGMPAIPDEHVIVVDWRRGDDRILVHGNSAPDEPLRERIETMLAAAS